MGKFKDLLGKNEYVILDGALGTELENRGYDVSGKLWSAKYLLENPKVISKPLYCCLIRFARSIIASKSS